MRLIYYLLVLTFYLLLHIGCRNIPPQTASAWLVGFAYRRPIVIQEKSGLRLVDYQVKIEIQGRDPHKSWCIDFSRKKSNAIMNAGRMRPLNR